MRFFSLLLLLVVVVCCLINNDEVSVKGFDLDLEYYRGFEQHTDLFVMAWYFNNFIADAALGWRDSSAFEALRQQGITKNVFGRDIQMLPEGYDLMQYSRRKLQYEMAKGIIDAFIYYHYWNGVPVIMEPLIARISDGQPALPFALCFVNEIEGSYNERACATCSLLTALLDAPRLHSHRW